jgi:hypothetical protein
VRARGRLTVTQGGCHDRCVVVTHFTARIRLEARLSRQIPVAAMA